MEDKKEMRFLIVDDMPNMVRTIRNMLRHLGYHSFADAEDGMSAWNVLKKNSYGDAGNVIFSKTVKRYNF